MGCQEKTLTAYLTNNPRRWLSIEPLIGPLENFDPAGLDWIVVGGKSAPKPRPMDPDWVRGSGGPVRRVPRCASPSLDPGAGPVQSYKRAGNAAIRANRTSTSDQTCYSVLRTGLRLAIIPRLG